MPLLYTHCIYYTAYAAQRCRWTYIVNINFNIISIFKKVVQIGHLIRLSQKGLYSAEAALPMLRIDNSLMLNAGFTGVDNPENMYISASVSVSASSSASASAST